MLKIYANGESGDIIWDGYLPDVINELAVANAAAIRIMADKIKKDDAEVMQALSKCLLREFERAVKRGAEEIEDKHKR